MAAADYPEEGELTRGFMLAAPRPSSAPDNAFHDDCV